VFSKKRGTDAVVKLANDYAAFDHAMPKDWLLSTLKKHPRSIEVAVTTTEVAGIAIKLQAKTPTGNIRGTSYSSPFIQAIEKKE